MSVQHCGMYPARVVHLSFGFLIGAYCACSYRSSMVIATDQRGRFWNGAGGLEEGRRSHDMQPAAHARSGL